jgi:hypothetical protein
MASSTTPIRPDRIRKIDGSFTFIPSRFLHDGFLASLSHDEAVLYLFLLLASNRHGVSRYHYDRICKTIGMDGDTYVQARNGLVAKELIAFDGSRFQVLALPPHPVVVPTPSNVDSDPTDRTHAPRDRSRSLQSIRDILAGLEQ